MAVPKSKVSKQRRNKRRSAHWKLAAPNLTACSKCGELKLSHQMCLACGTYNGRVVIAGDDGKKKK
jgi:large subunit ribosomal protein L32